MFKLFHRSQLGCMPQTGINYYSSSSMLAMNIAFIKKAGGGCMVSFIYRKKVKKLDAFHTYWNRAHDEYQRASRLDETHMEAYFKEHAKFKEHIWHVIS